MSFPNLDQYLQLTKLPTQQQPAFLEHLFDKIDQHKGDGGRILLITLTKKSAEEVTNFLISKGYRAFYLHSEIDTFERWEIIKKLKNGTIDILVWVNLLREGIDLPEVSLIGILDADQEGFLRSTTALVQIIGRAARHTAGEVVLYADRMTEAMTMALWETYRRRGIQEQSNEERGVTPTTAISLTKDLWAVKTDEELTQDFASLTRGKQKRLGRMTKKEKAIIMKDLKAQLDACIEAREFEKAATIRDQIKEIEEG